MNKKSLGRILILFLFTTFFIFTSTSFAQRSSRSSGGGPRFSVGLYGIIGQGKMGNGLEGSGNAPDRDMLHTPIGLFLGFNIKKFRIGVNYEHMIIGQTTEPSEVGDTNLSGSGSAPGVRLEYYDGKNAFGVIYRLGSDFKLDKATQQGTEANYKKGTGFSVQYMRQLKNKLGIVLDYSTEDYAESLTTGNVKMNRIGLGIVFSNFASSGGRKR
jgi:hypothetical protein